MISIFKGFVNKTVILILQHLPGCVFVTAFFIEFPEAEIILQKHRPDVRKAAFKIPAIITHCIQEVISDIKTGQGVVEGLIKI